MGSEVGQAINTLAGYGMIGMNFHNNSSADVGGNWITSHNVTSSEGVSSSSPGPFGPIGSSPHRYNESSFDPFRRTYQTPLPLHGNSFGLGSPHSPVAQDRTADSINTSPRGSETSRAELQVGEHIVGAILGPGGKALLEIQHFSGANIPISKKGIYAPGTRNRWVTISGTPNAISTAQYLIEQHVAFSPAHLGKTIDSPLFLHHPYKQILLEIVHPLTQLRETETEKETEMLVAMLRDFFHCTEGKNTV